MNANIITPRWPAPKNIHAFTTLRHGMGVSQVPFDHFNLGNRYSDQGDTPSAVETNRKWLMEKFSLPSAPHWLRQVHGVEVLRFDSPANLTGDFNRDEPVADAAVTSQKNIVLSILTADCLPVLFCNTDGTEVGAAHAGWRGLAAGMLEHTVSAMNSKPETILAWLGPGAGPLAYEVGAEVYAAFIDQDSNAVIAFTATRKDHWRVDLYQLARLRLHKLGVTDIAGGEHCTISEPEKFFSHRRDHRTGRMASLIWMQ
jgi:polyphenol oxidase